MRLRYTWRHVARFYWRPFFIAVGLAVSGATLLVLAPTSATPRLVGMGYFAGAGLALWGTYMLVVLAHGVLIYRGRADLLTVTSTGRRAMLRRRQSGLYLSRKSLFVEDATVSAYVEMERAPRGSRMAELVLSSGDEHFRLRAYMDSGELLEQLGTYLGGQGIALVRAEVAPARDTAP